MDENSLSKRLKSFALTLGAAFFIVYAVLPALTERVGILKQMSQALEASGIDPSRYYYTDVEQVAESEAYLHTALDGHRGF